MTGSGKVFIKMPRGFYINDFPSNYRPMAQPINDFHENNKLAAIFELKVGKGKLLICGFDLKAGDPPKNAPVARQLKNSILHYMNSGDFLPPYQCSADSLKKMLVYVEPLKADKPGEFSKAILYIESGAKMQGEGWNQKYDKFESQKKSGYSVICDKVLKNGDATAWAGKELTVKVHCPQGVQGSLFVYFYNWKGDGPKGKVIFEDREYQLYKYEKDGVWIKLNVMREDSLDGMLQF